MLSGKGIIAMREQGNIIIQPLIHDQLGPNSYDITLGPWAIRNKKVLPGTPPIDVSNIEDLKRAFDVPKNYEEDGKITWRPWERILCHTNEIIGTIAHYVALVETRSTLARWGLDCCGSAGFGDVGFVNKWTLEISNFNNFAVTVPVGARIGQMSFDSLEYSDDDGVKYGGDYMDKSRAWKPEDMLPKSITKES